MNSEKLMSSTLNTVWLLVSSIALCFSIILSSNPASAAQQITVGYEENPPIAYTGTSGNPTGMSVELLKKIAKEEDWQLIWKPCIWEKCLDGLSTSEIDLLVGIGQSKEREAIYSFTMEAVIVNWGQVYAAKNQNISTVLDLSQKRVALVTTDMHGKFFSDIMTRFGMKYHAVPVNSYADALKAVLTQKADVCVVSRIYPLSSEELNRVNQTPVIFNPVQNKYATLKDKHHNLLLAIDNNLVRLKADKDSFYYRNLEHWLGVSARRVVPAWFWWCVALGTVIFGAAMGWWRYSSVIKLNQKVSDLKENLHTVFNNTDKGIIIHNQQGRILAVNSPAQRLYGATESELLTLTILDLSAESDEKHQQLPQMMAHIISGNSLQMEWRCRNIAENRCFDAEIFYTGILWDNESVLMGMVHDITVTKQQEALIKRLSTAVEQSANTIVITSKNGKIQYANPSFERMTGYTVNEALGKTPRMLKSGIHPPEYYKELWNKLLAGEIWQGSFCNKHKNGDLFWESTVITPIIEDGNITHFIAIKEDVTEKKKHEEDVYRQANFDELTNLPNRNRLRSWLLSTVDDTSRCCDSISLMLLDLDDFKVINNTMGHTMGDRLLKAVSERLVTSVTPEDIVSRLGGDEFAISPLHACNDTQLTEFASKVMQSFIKPFIIDGQEFYITASMGGVRYPEDGESIETLLRNADTAMYCAKSKGRNLFERYSRELHDHYQERLELETRLRRALERNEFLVYYQPQLELTSGRVSGFEALLRWQPQDGEMIFPDKFIPVLEQTGLIVPVGEWVLREVFQQLKQWHAAGMEIQHASVNVSFLQFRRPDIVERIVSIAQETDVSPCNISLELTESIMMDDIDETLLKLEALQTAGFSISIDDFGTGYSSLAYLRQMSIHELKIDKSFVATLPETSATLVKTILSMAKNLGLRVVAEGVETEQQLAFLKQQNCESIQGYLISRPLPKQQFEAFFTKFINRTSN